MPKRVYLEGVIESVVLFTKTQLQNTIFPAFDPVYIVNMKSKGKNNTPQKKKAGVINTPGAQSKNLISFYQKLHEVVGLLAELLHLQILTDSTVLHLSSLGVAPFFVENVPQLQFSAMKLVTGIFTQYENHRRLLLDDILASVARLPTSKRSLRTFKLSPGANIQMLTALVLQLIQCVTFLPDQLSIITELEGDEEDRFIDPEKDLLISGKFDTAVNTAGHFLSSFLSKCGKKSGYDCDYKILFQNFLQDLLSCVNKPEWPAAELCLSLLGNLLVKYLENKGLDVPMRVASLEYLGVAAARLRKDVVGAQAEMESIDKIIKDVRKREEDCFVENAEFESEEEKVEYLQRILLDYLAIQGRSDPALVHARHFHIACWWKGASTEIERKREIGVREGKKRRRRESSYSNDEDDEEAIDETEEEADNIISKLAFNRKKFLLGKIKSLSEPFTPRKIEMAQTFLDYQSAELLTRYLSSKRPFTAGFDFFLIRILRFSMDTTVAIRTKGLRCLTMVVEADPSVLARNDMQIWVHNSFLDQSTSVREAAVDLVGKYVLSCPNLIDKYYDKLSERILDTGVSVRKRVIKILRDICIQLPNFQKIPEICVKLIRRVNDEEGVRKLVMQVFQNMWFTPVRSSDDNGNERLLSKVSNITDVVKSSEKVGLDFLEQLLASLFKPNDDNKESMRGRQKILNCEPPPAVLEASKQIVDCLVEHVLRIEETESVLSEATSSSSSKRFSACAATLFLFAKVRPQLLITHATTLEGYLSLRCQNSADLQAVSNIASILELVVPLMVNPANSFLAQVEEDCVKLIFKNDRNVIETCMACLGAVVNKMTRNYSLIRDCFRKLYEFLTTQTKLMRENPLEPLFSHHRPQLRRAIFTSGLFFRYFDFTSADVYGSDYSPDIVQQIFAELLFMDGDSTGDFQYLAIQAIGNLCVRHYDFMLGSDLKKIYKRILLTTVTNTKEDSLKIQILLNIQLYLTEEEKRLIRQDSEWTQIDNIKEMGDDNGETSGMASTIIQLYLKEILESYLHPNVAVRRSASVLIQLILRQGLVYPIQIVPYLISMSTDEDQGVATVADKQLQEIWKKYPQFLQSQGLNGIRTSLVLHRLLASSNSDSNPVLVRGFIVREKEAPSALIGFLYSLLRSSKTGRRGLASSLLKQFDENHHDHLETRLPDLLYFADNLAHFPYQVVDEPMYIIHQLDTTISINGSEIVQCFKESLLSPHCKSELDGYDEMDEDEYSDDDDDGEDECVERLAERIPEGDTKKFEDYINASQGILLLLNLKEHLINVYGLSDNQIREYSPSNSSKSLERSVKRRSNSGLFNPKAVLEHLNRPRLSSATGFASERGKALIKQFLQFKKLMLKIDSGVEDDESDY
ncbi:unnamed protein product [Orchesella dallaii]